MATDIGALTGKISKVVQAWGEVTVEEADSLLLEHEQSEFAVGIMVGHRNEHYDLVEVLFAVSELFEVLDNEKELARVSAILNDFNAHASKGKAYINDESVVVVESVYVSRGEEILGEGYLVSGVFDVAELASDVQFRLNHGKPEGEYSKPLLNARKN